MLATISLYLSSLTIQTITVPILRRYITAKAELCNRINGALNKIAVFSQGLLLHRLVILMQAKAAY